MSLTSPIDATLKDNLSVRLVLTDKRDVGLSSVRFASLRPKGFSYFGGGRHEHRRRDAEPIGELEDLADVQVALAC